MAKKDKFSAELTETLFSDAPDAILLINHRGKIEQASDQVEALQPLTILAIEG